jgi:hypothetical protein
VPDNSDMPSAAIMIFFILCISLANENRNAVL